MALPFRTAYSTTNVLGHDPNPDPGHGRNHGQSRTLSQTLGRTEIRIGRRMVHRGHSQDTRV